MGEGAVACTFLVGRIVVRFADLQRGARTLLLRCLHLFKVWLFRTAKKYFENYNHRIHIALAGGIYFWLAPVSPCLFSVRLPDSLKPHFRYFDSYPCCQDEGYLARVRCIEVWCDMSTEFFTEQLANQEVRGATSAFFVSVFKSTGDSNSQGQTLGKITVSKGMFVHMSRLPEGSISAYIA